MKRILVTLIVLAALMVAGCTDSQRKNITTLGSTAHIQLYSGGKLVGEWDSTGKVTTVSQSDGWEFVDQKTGKFLRIAGDIIITN